MKLLVIGGTTFIGYDLIRQALEDDHDVTLLSLDRPKLDVKWVQGDRRCTSVPGEFDAIIDNIALEEGDVYCTLIMMKGRFGRYVLTSSVDIYENRELRFCDEQAHDVMSPRLGASYVHRKRRLEVELRSAKVPATIIRPAITLGVRDNIKYKLPYARSLFFGKRLDGPMLLPIGDYKLFQVAYVRDVARALLLGATHPAAANRIFNVCGDEVFTLERFVQDLAAAAGVEPLTICRTDRNTLSSINYHVPFASTKIHKHALFATDRLKGLGWQPTPFREWAHELVSDDLPTVVRANEHIIARSCIDKSTPALRPVPPQPKLSTVGIGTYLGAEDDVTDIQYANALTRALDGGINVIDTALNYRNERSERVVGTIVRPRRQDAFVITKGGFWPRGGHSLDPKRMQQSFERSYSNLGLEYIDLFLIHNPEKELIDVGSLRFYDNLTACFAMLEQKVRDNKLRSYGIATWTGLTKPIDDRGHVSLERVLACARLAAGGPSRFNAIELPYNSLNQAADTARTQVCNEQLQTVFDFAGHNDLLVFTSDTLNQGRLSAANELPRSSTHPQITTALIGMRKLEHVDEALRYNSR